MLASQLMLVYPLALHSQVFSKHYPHEGECGINFSLQPYTYELDLNDGVIRQKIDKTNQVCNRFVKMKTYTNSNHFWARLPAPSS